MAQADFLNQLRDLGFQPQDLGNGKVAIDFVVPVGKFAGEAVKIGFQVPPDFPLTSPGGPHVCPKLLPLNNTQGIPHPAGAIHASDFGGDWEYWSRPFPKWAGTDRTVRAYLAHVRGLFATQ